MDKSWGIPVDAEVYSADGENLGSVVAGAPCELEVERGFLIVHDYQIKLSDVERVEDGKSFLRLSKEQVEREVPLG
jgi:hypothetical protein